MGDGESGDYKVKEILSLPNSGEVTLELVDITGKATLIFRGKEQKGTNTYNYNTDGLKPGVYVFRLQCNEQQVSQKFIKE